MALISINDALTKHVSENIGVGHILAIRGSFICLIVMFVIRFRREPVFPGELFQTWNVVRSFLEMVATIFFVLCLGLLPLAIASTLIWTSPLVLTLLAAGVLKEPVNATRWGAVAVGFLGVCLVTRPGSATWQWAMLLPIAAAALGGARDLVTRFVAPGLSSLHIALSAALLTTLAGSLLSCFEPRSPDPVVFAWLALSAVLFSSGYTLFVVAIRSGDLSFVAPFSYSSIVFAIVLGALIWHEAPDGFALLGAGVIVAAGVAILYAEDKEQR